LSNQDEKGWGNPLPFFIFFYSFLKKAVKEYFNFVFNFVVCESSYFLDILEVKFVYGSREEVGDGKE
jgi:hypothetical protein